MNGRRAHPARRSTRMRCHPLPGRAMTHEEGKAMMNIRRNTMIGFALLALSAAGVAAA